VQRDVAAEDRGRAVTRVVVGKRPDAGPYLTERLNAGAWLAGIDIIGAADGERDPVTFRQRDAGRPDLDVDLIDLVRGQLLLFVVRMIGAVWQRQIGVELAMGAAQPPLGDRRVGGLFRRRYISSS